MFKHYLMNADCNYCMGTPRMMKGLLGHKCLHLHAGARQVLGHAPLLYSKQKKFSDEERTCRQIPYRRLRESRLGATARVDQRGHPARQKMRIQGTPRIHITKRCHRLDRQGR